MLYIYLLIYAFRLGKTQIHIQVAYVLYLCP